MTIVCENGHPPVLSRADKSCSLYLHFLYTTAPAIATPYPAMLMIVVCAPSHTTEMPMSNKSLSPPATFIDRALVRLISQKMLRLRAKAVAALPSRTAMSWGVTAMFVSVEASRSAHKRLKQPRAAGAR